MQSFVSLVLPAVIGELKGTLQPWDKLHFCWPPYLQQTPRNWLDLTGSLDSIPLHTYLFIGKLEPLLNGKWCQRYRSTNPWPEVSVLPPPIPSSCPLPVPTGEWKHWHRYVFQDNPILPECLIGVQTSSKFQNFIFLCGKNLPLWVVGDISSLINICAWC